MKKIRIQHISKTQLFASALLVVFMALSVGIPSEQFLMEAVAQEQPNDETSFSPPPCSETIDDNKFVGNPWVDPENPCSGFCGSIDIGYGWTLISIVDNCVDVNGNPLQNPASVKIDHDGLHSGYCISFDGERAANCTPKAHVRCIEADGTVVNHYVEKAITVPELQEDCECQCQLGGYEASPEPARDQCGAEVVWLSDESECENQPPTNCGGAPTLNIFLSADAVPCAGTVKNIACVLDQTSGKCKAIQTTDVDFEVRTLYFMDCKDPAINQGKACKECQCGMFVDAANGPIRFVPAELVLIAALLGQPVSLAAYGYECVNVVPTTETEPVIP